MVGRESCMALPKDSVQKAMEGAGTAQERNSEWLDTEMKAERRGVVANLHHGSHGPRLLAFMPCVVSSQAELADECDYEAMKEMVSAFQGGVTERRASAWTL